MTAILWVKTYVIIPVGLGPDGPVLDVDGVEGESLVLEGGGAAAPLTSGLPNFA